MHRSIKTKTFTKTQKKNLTFHRNGRSRKQSRYSREWIQFYEKAEEENYINGSVNKISVKLGKL